MSNNLINLGIRKEVKELFKENGKNLEEIEEIEYEKASLDNESIDDIFSSVEEIDEIPIVSVDSKKNKKE